MKIAIIGAGAGGLSAAYDLSKAGHDVTIFEAGAEVGGLAAGFKAEGWDWTLEKFYHHWFSTDEAVLDLINEIGQAGKVQFEFPITSLWQSEGNYPLDQTWFGNPLLSRMVNVLSLKPLPLLDRIRFGAVGLLLKLYRNGIALEKHTADAWLLRAVGRRAHELVWRPMLIGKFGPLYDRVNMAWFWARMYKRTAALGTFEGGFQAFLNALAEAVTAQGADLRLNTPVQGLTRQAGGIEITLADETFKVDAVLSTTSPRLMARLAVGLPDEYTEKLNALQSMGALALVLALDRELMPDGTYWLNLPANSPDKESNPFPFLALVEHTHYMDKAHYGGDHLIYCGDYLAPDHPFFKMDKDELSAHFLPALKKVNPDFSADWVRVSWLFKAPYAQPVPFVNHSEKIPDIRTPLAGVYFASMSQVYPWDRGTNYAVEIGRRAAQMMMADENG